MRKNNQEIQNFLTIRLEKRYYCTKKRAEPNNWKAIRSNCSEIKVKVGYMNLEVELVFRKVKESTVRIN